ncbi:MAG: hypothetical protein ACK41T_12620 [Pseudobdellovibrio sp.]
MKTLNIALMRLLSLVIFGQIVFCSSLLASLPKNENVIKSKASLVEVDEPYRLINDSPIYSSYPEWMWWVLQKSQGWVPSFEADEACKLSFSSPELDPKVCEARYSLNLWSRYLSKLYVRFDISDTHHFQRIMFEPQKGLKIRGLLAQQKNLKQGESRPLVILRLGIHGNIDNFLAERFLARILYQDLGYHVLILENLTSHGFLSLNDRVTFGGIEEGLHNFYIINLFSHHKISWSQQVSDIYLMGVSLGGQGVFVANYLDENSIRLSASQDVLEQSQPSIKAIQLFCPVVNLDLTMADLENSGFFSAGADIWNRDRFVALKNKNPDLYNDPDWWKIFFDLKPRFMTRVLSWINKTEPKPLMSLEIFKEQFPDVVLPQDFINHVESSQSFIELNKFWSFYKNNKTPILIYTTPDDPAVPTALNTDLIREGKQKGEFNKVNFMNLKGLHCALAPEYQWPYLVEMIKRGFESR